MENEEENLIDFKVWFLNERGEHVYMNVKAKDEEHAKEVAYEEDKGNTSCYIFTITKVE